MTASPPIPPPADACAWCHKDCGGTCLGLTSSTQMRPDDPAYFLLTDGVVSRPVVHRADCYICRDPEFAQMGLPLCRKCPACPDGHVPADDETCTDCGADERAWYEVNQPEVFEPALAPEPGRYVSEPKTSGPDDETAAEQLASYTVARGAPLALTDVLARLRASIVRDRCLACAVGVATGPESHDPHCPNASRTEWEGM